MVKYDQVGSMLISIQVNRGYDYPLGLKKEYNYPSIMSVQRLLKHR